VSAFLGHFHPLAVHFPLALVALAAALEAWALVRAWRGRRSSLRGVVPLLLAFAALGGAAAAATGWLLGSSMGLAGPVYERHRLLGTILAVSVPAAAVASALALRGSRAARVVSLALIAHCALLLVGTGHLGGTLTHGEGWLTRHAPARVQAFFGAQPRVAVGPAEQAVVYAALVQPILERRCTDCHGASAARGGLRLDSPEAIRKGGEHGAVIAAGKPEASELMRRIWLPASHAKAMPGAGREPVSASEAAVLRWWIASGAAFDATLADLELAPDARVPVEAIVGPLAPAGPALPRDSVAAADPKRIDELRALGLSVRPVALELPFLDVRAGGAAVDDTRVGRLEAIAPQLVWLDLAGAGITDAGAAVLGRLPNLVRLDLSRTSLGDAGLARLAGLSRLESLNLHGTRVSDAGLAALEKLPKLRSVYLWGSAVTPAGVETLRVSRPHLAVDAGDLEPREKP
jgi:uncharacterized membrane protein